MRGLMNKLSVVFVVSVLALSAGLVGCAEEDKDSAMDMAPGQGDENNGGEVNNGDQVNNGDEVNNGDLGGVQGDRLDAPVYGVRGAHAVGFRVFEVAREQGAPLKVKAWYPASNPEGAAESIVYELEHKVSQWEEVAPGARVAGQALREAPLMDGAGPFSVVVFSHGFGLSAEWYSDLVEHYASHGFVVLAPEHTEEDWLQAARASFERPAEVSLTLDLAEELYSEGDWAQLLKLENIAVVGHSYGGYTALASAGARFDLGPMREHCAALPQDDPRAFLCAPFVGQEAYMAELAGLDEVPEGLWPSLGDPRVSAIVPISSDAYLFNEGGLASVTVPVMSMGGTADFAAPWDWGTLPAYAASSSEDKVLVGFQGGSHFLATNLCESMAWLADVDELYGFACFDPVWDKQRALDLTQHFSTAFLLATFEGDAQAAAMLDPGAVWMPGIEYARTAP